jgi:hypothetical protein
MHKSNIRNVLILVCSVLVVCSVLIGTRRLVAGQTGAAPTLAASGNQPPLPPATKLEGFKPTAGTLVTFGYDELGGFLISVDVRELRGMKGPAVRGLLVEVYESEYRKERAFVDADEIPELLKGIDALMQVRTNPTQFKQFEVRYTTLGELQLTVYNEKNGEVRYAVAAGRTLKANRGGLKESDMIELRKMFEAAAQKLASLSGS